MTESTRAKLSPEGRASRMGWRFAAQGVAALLLLCPLAARADTSLPPFNADTLSSGQVNPLAGSDGAFTIAAPASGTKEVLFDPAHIRVGVDPTITPCASPCAQPLDPDHDNVFHFTTITIPAGVTVKLSAKWTNGPVYWLATGDVNIQGTVDLSGGSGHNRTQSALERTPSVPGPGGYQGGIGGNYGSSPSLAQPGAGPGGGAANSNGAYNNGYGSGYAATLAGTPLLVPLVGGSGGGGGSSNEFAWWGAGGGAGGGAILVASSTLINVTGTITVVGGHSGTANNGSGGCPNFSGGGGAAGSIRLVAPELSGGGQLRTLGGYGNAGGCSSTLYGPEGRVRLEAYKLASFSIPYGYWTTGSPLNSFVPSTPPPSIRVLTVAGVPVASDATGGFSPPDVSINNTAPVPVVIEARYVPAGTAPTLVLFSLEATDQVLTLPALAATSQANVTTTTTLVTFPAGFTRGYVRATW